MENKPVVIVARVSTDEQAATGYSLPTQLTAMRKYAAERLGRLVLEEITDDCSGAIPIFDRPGGARLQALIDAGQVSAVIFFTLDRTARDERVMEYLLLKSYLHDRGIELHYTDTGLDPYTMEGNLLGYIKAHAATAERAKIAERSTRGRHAKAKAGHWVGSGFAAFGYSRAGTGREAQIAIDEREAAIVRMIFEWFTVLGLSLRAIALRLGAEGIEPPNHRRHSAERWIPATVRRILRNELYTGRVYYGKTRIVNKRQQNVPRELWTLVVEAPDLAIIELAQFEAAQERLEYNRHNLACRNARHEYLLTGYLNCGRCGSAMGGTFTTLRENGHAHERTYYRCRRYGRNEAEPCAQKGKTVSCRKADSLIWNWLLDVTTPEKLDIGLKNWRANDDNRLGAVRSVLDNIAKQEAQAERALARLTAALANANDEAAAALEVEINRAGRKLADLRAERAKRQGELAKVELTPERDTYIRAAAAAIRGRMAEGATFARKRDLLQMLNFQVKFIDDETGRNISVVCDIGGALLPLS